MWVPVISLVWTIAYLMQGRFAHLRISDDDECGESKGESKKVGIDETDREEKVECRETIIESDRHRDETGLRNFTDHSGEKDKRESKKFGIEGDYEKIFECKETIIKFDRGDAAESKNSIKDSDEKNKRESGELAIEGDYEKIVECKETIIKFDRGDAAESKNFIKDSDEKNKRESGELVIEGDYEKIVECKETIIKFDRGDAAESKNFIKDSDEKNKRESGELVIEGDYGKIVECKETIIKFDRGDAVDSSNFVKDSDGKNERELKKILIEGDYEKKIKCKETTIKLNRDSAADSRYSTYDLDKMKKKESGELVIEADYEEKVERKGTAMKLNIENVAESRDSINDSDDESKADSRKLKGECFYNIEEMMIKVNASYPRSRINYNTVTLLSFALGLVGGWTSPFLAKLTGPDSELPVTAIEASWIASLIQLGRVFGAVIGSLGVAYLGTKFSVLSIGVPVVISWILLVVADTVGWIYVARSLQGISTGMFFSSFPLYAGEISSPKIRGAVISLIMSAMAIGSLIGNLVGSLTSMSLFSFISLVPSVAFLVLFALLPASPHYLVSRGRHDDAAKAIVWYQRDADVATELESLKRFIDDQREATFGDTLRELNVPRNRKAFLLVMIVFMLLQVGGTYAMGYYMEIILRRAGVKTILDPGMAVVGIGIFGITGGFLAMYTNDKFGRKFALAGSAGGLAISLIVLGVHYTLMQNGYGTTSLEWLPVITMAIFNFFICMGIATVPSTIVSELFPPRIKSIAACAANMTSGLFAFISIKTYQQMVDIMPDQCVFWFYAAMMAVLAIYTVISLPETKGKSLQEIQDMLAKK